MNRLLLPLTGLRCQSCVKEVSKSLAEVPDVSQVEVDLDSQQATIQFDQTKPNHEALVAAVQSAGFDVLSENEATSGSSEEVQSEESSSEESSQFSNSQDTKDTNKNAQNTTTEESTKRWSFDIEGMHCASCVGRVEKAFQTVPSVQSAQVNLALNQASVVSSEETTLESLQAAIENAGYSAKISSDEENRESYLAKQTAQLNLWKIRLCVASLCLLGMLVVTRLFSLPHLQQAWVLFLLATPVQFYVGYTYFYGAFKRLKYFSADMDTLIALGTGVAYLAAVVDVSITTFAPTSRIQLSEMPGMYFMDATMILTIITCGRYLEAQAKGRASAAIHQLLDLTPPKAHVVRDDQIQEVALKEVQQDETIQIKPGEKVPLDATIVTGHSSLNESWLTGESMPVEKKSGDEIFAGTINGDGTLTATVTSSQGKTVLAQIIQLVKEAQQSKAQIQRLADVVTSYFVPAVLFIAAITFLSWIFASNNLSIAIQCSIAVLVVACPCALGLATPTAVLVASGRGAELGILIKNAHSLELAGQVNTVVFDKTGTITQGKMQVVTVEPTVDSNVDLSAEDLIKIAASVEQQSQHPLANAIVNRAKQDNLKLETSSNLQVIPGRGIEADLGDDHILIGNEHLLQDITTENQTDIQQRMETLRKSGELPLVVIRNQHPLGIIALSDPIGEHSKEAITKLKKLGLELTLLSGDHQQTAQRVADEVGIETVIAEVLPHEKKSTIEQLKQQGKKVAMVGDGINDAPALASADLGIAIGSGTDVALEAADVVIVGNDLRSVAKTILLSRATLSTIRENLVWAFLYNILLIPVAAGLLTPFLGKLFLLPPIAAASAMALSSVSVVFNSLLLKRKKLD